MLLVLCLEPFILIQVTRLWKPGVLLPIAFAANWRENSLWKEFLSASPPPPPPPTLLPPFTVVKKNGPIKSSKLKIGAASTRDRLFYYILLPRKESYPWLEWNSQDQPKGSAFWSVHPNLNASVVCELGLMNCCFLLIPCQEGETAQPC